MSDVNLDVSFYLVFVRLPGGDVVAAERTLADFTSLSRTALDVFHGQIAGDVVHVIECNPVEGWSRNITADVADMLAHLVNVDFDDNHQRPRLELHAFIEKHGSIKIPAAADLTFAAA